jgi:hypothetical protein
MIVSGAYMIRSFFYIVHHNDNLFLLQSASSPSIKTVRGWRGIGVLGESRSSDVDTLLYLVKNSA